jgi:hypothetical protein
LGAGVGYPIIFIYLKSKLQMRNVALAIKYLVLAHIIILSQSVMADEIPDRLVIKAGSYIVNSIDTDISVNPQGGLLGSNIKYSKDLGGEDSTTVPRIQGYYRFNDRHRIDFGYYKVDRSGQRTLDAELVIGDEVYPVNAAVSSNLDVSVFKTAYTYSFYHNSKVELGASAGLHLMDYSYLVTNNNATIRTDDDFTAPLPVFGFLVNYNITPAWSFYVRPEIFYIEIEDQYKGSLVDFMFGTEYRVFKHVSFGISVNRMSIDAEVDEPNFRGSINEVYKGLTIYTGIYF